MRTIVRKREKMLIGASEASLTSDITHHLLYSRQCRNEFGINLSDTVRTYKYITRVTSTIDIISKVVTACTLNKSFCKCTGPTIQNGYGLS
jgi:hypothetical protein